MRPYIKHTHTRVVHHPEEDDQVAVVFDEREDSVHGVRECRPLRTDAPVWLARKGT